MNKDSQGKGGGEGGMRRGEGKGSDTEKEGCDPLDNSPMLAGLNIAIPFCVGKLEWWGYRMV